VARIRFGWHLAFDEESGDVEKNGNGSDKPSNASRTDPPSLKVGVAERLFHASPPYLTCG
jgi:hypothetical protein